MASPPIAQDVRKAPLHPEEDRRLVALRSLGILDTEAEERFDRITRLAARVLDVPTALFSLVDEERQWFKSRVGLDVCETSRDESFCAYAILETDGDPFVIEDTSLDDRFFDNPLVTGAPNIRFYAGQVVHSSAGLPIGTLCVVDHKPRSFDAGQRQALKDLAALVTRELDRVSEHDLLLQIDESERRKSLILDTMSEGIVLQDQTGEILSWNLAAERVLGLSSEELSGRTSFDPRWQAIHEDGSPWPGDTHPAIIALKTGKAVSAAVMGVHKPSGELAWLRINAQPAVDNEGNVVSSVTAFADVTAEHNMMTGLRRFKYLFQHANDIISVIDLAGNVQYSSPSAERLLGYPAEFSMTGGVLSLVHPDDAAFAQARLRAVVGNTAGRGPFVVRVKAYSGAWMFLECIVVNLLNEPAVNAIVITARDVTDRQIMAEQLAYRAAHDELTDLPNRRKLTFQVNVALEKASREDRSIGLCFIDLDGFKKVNDQFGHRKGDEVLVAVANGIRGVLRPTDSAARVGGDEFIIVLDPVADSEDAYRLASDLRKAIVTQQVEGLTPGFFGASMGLALSGADDTQTSIMQRADAALYRAKVERGRVEIADATLPVICSQ